MTREAVVAGVQGQYKRGERVRRPRRDFGTMTVARTLAGLSIGGDLEKGICRCGLYIMACYCSASLARVPGLGVFFCIG